jgi:hypothetical protein
VQIVDALDLACGCHVKPRLLQLRLSGCFHEEVASSFLEDRAYVTWNVPACVFTIQHGTVDVVNCPALNGVVVSHSAVQELVLWHVAVVLHVFSMLSHCMLLCPKHASVM